MKNQDFLKLQLGYEYNINVLKEIKITEDVLIMESNVKGCENEIKLEVI